MSILSLISEKQLVEDAKSDKKAFEKLYLKYSNHIYRFIFSKVNSIADAEDLTSEVWVKIVSKIQSFNAEKETSFKSWIFTIAYHQVLDFYKSKANLNENLGENINFIIEQDNVEQKAIDKFDFKNSLDILNLLPEKQKECIKMKYIAELKNIEIAQILNIDQKTVSSNLVRGLRKLRELMNSNLRKNLKQY